MLLWFGAPSLYWVSSQLEQPFGYQLRELVSFWEFGCQVCIRLFLGVCRVRFWSQPLRGHGTSALRPNLSIRPTLAP